MSETTPPAQPSGGPEGERTLPLQAQETDATLPLQAAEQDATVALPVAPASAPKPNRLPKTIGEFEILGVLGVGGMGVVYEARQLSPHRKVALKVMRQALVASHAQTQQFRREVETLGRLVHPNIATIFASGQTEDGMDYYAMELVQGETLDAWLEKRPAKLTQQELKLRLQMFCAISDAVHYAHLRGVIHRDLKPSNIMVLESQGDSSRGSGAEPALKILDFGLARLVDPENQSASMMTEAGVIMGTLQYMSPEQARGDTLAVDFRTDVYALGVILFEMTSGKRPYDVGRAALSEAIRMICEEPPARLDPSVGGSRSAHADLATIVGKSLEKEADRRYPSAGALSEDVGRYLRSEPIVARPPSRVYQARMFVRRHRFGVSSTAALVLLLLCFALVTAIQSRRIAREAEVSRRVSDFMVRMFQVSDPGEARGNAVTAREILDGASRNIESGLAQDPEIQGRLMHTMGTVYKGLGLYSKALELLQGSLKLARGLGGDQAPEALSSQVDIGTIYDLEGRYGDAERIYLETLPLMQRVKGKEHPDTLRLMNNLGVVYADLQRFPEAERLSTEVVRLMKRTLGPDHFETLNAMTNLANLYFLTGRLDEARRLVEETLQAKRRTLGAEHPATLASLNNLAAILTEQKDYPRAEQMDLEAVRMERKVMGPEHPETLNSLSNLARVYYLEGRMAETESTTQEVLAIQERVLQPHDPNLGDTYYSLACLRARQGDTEGALRRLTQARAAGMTPTSAKAMDGDEDLASLRKESRFKELSRQIQADARVSTKP
jgi:non-specific serine/threonine protein kinase/serine/threonine-protein kinase